MSHSNVSRRDLLGMASATAAVATLPLLSSPAAQAQSGAPTVTAANLLSDAEALLTSIHNAFAFQNLMMDAYATGSTVRLVQSYSDQALGATAFTYDNAVSIHAYLARGEADDLARAEVLGAGLLYAQAHNFPVSDGRFAQGYYVNVAAAGGAYITPAAAPYYFYTSTVGDQAWAGMALAQLYAKTGNSRCLAGALLVANWIVTNAYNTEGPGGFSFGTTINSSNQSVPSTNGKSTEHNIDTYAFFTMLSKLTEDANANNGMAWSALAQHAASFVAAMYNSSSGQVSGGGSYYYFGPFYYTGTLGDQVTINPSPVPEDCQTWSFLAGLGAQTSASIDFVPRALFTQDTAFGSHTSLTGNQEVFGVRFGTLVPAELPAADYNAVWFEGTAHFVTATIARILSGTDALPYGLLTDLRNAIAYLQQLVYAQQTFGAGQTAGGRAIPVGLGLVAASSVLDTGFGYTYGPSLHIGATGWYLLAALIANPFQLGYRVRVP